MDYAVIMAGGSGKRLWPLSRQNRPKQVLRLLNGRTLLAACLDRLLPVFPPERIWVLTNAEYVDLVRADLPAVPPEQVVAEPVVRDTAGAIGLAASILASRDEDAAMAVVTADQVIEPAAALQAAIRDALAFVRTHDQALFVFGIRPTCPSTQYGYIKCLRGTRVAALANLVHRVEAFKEKPDLATAQGFVADGHYFWNSGMFVWKARTILDQLARFLPACVDPLQAIRKAWPGPDRDRVIKDQFSRLPKISIDFAVMERAPEVYALRLDCRWLDVGSFPSLAEVVTADEQGNCLTGGAGLALDCRNSILVTEDKGHLIAALGVTDLIVAHSPDATLVCPKDQAGRLKELLDRLESAGYGSYL